MPTPPGKKLYWRGVPILERMGAHGAPLYAPGDTAAFVYLSPRSAALAYLWARAKPAGHGYTYWRQPHTGWWLVVSRRGRTVVQIKSPDRRPSRDLLADVVTEDRAHRLERVLCKRPSLVKVLFERRPTMGGLLEYWKGIPLVVLRRAGGEGRLWRAALPKYDMPWRLSPREAAKDYLLYRDRPAPYRYRLMCVTRGRWQLRRPNGVTVPFTVWTGFTRPKRSAVLDAIIADRKVRVKSAMWRRKANQRALAARPDESAPSTLGWRAWKWDDQANCLRSPHIGTLWTGPDLTATAWSSDAALRGCAGIHARRMPRNWLRAGWHGGGGSEGPEEQDDLVTGVVERFGRYVLGEVGWRAEHVVIRELCAPNVRVMLKLMQVYPEVKVHLSPHANEEGG